MNAQVPATREPKPQLVAGAPVAALVPQTLEEAFRLAGALAASGMAPRGMDKPEQIMVAIMAGAELGLAPFQSLQSFAVVNGRPTLWGDGLMAVVKARGVKVREWFEGEADDLIARCEVTRPDTGEVTPGEFSVADAKKAGLWGKQGPWQQYPKRMLKMRARVALRDGCADMLRGIQIREEVEDYQPIRDVTPATTGMRARLEARQTADAPGFDADHIARETGAQPAHDPETGEITEATVETIDPPADDGLLVRDDTADNFPGDTPPTTDPLTALRTGADLLADQAEQDPDFDPIDWAASFTRGLDQLPTVEEVAGAWKEAQKSGRVRTLKARNEGMAKALAEAVNARVAAINGTDD